MNGAGAGGGLPTGSFPVPPADGGVYAGIPALPVRGAVAVALLNALVPGAGTMALARRARSRGLLVKGALQVLAAFVLVGWLWAAVTSIKAVGNALEAETTERLLVRAAPPS